MYRLNDLFETRWGLSSCRVGLSIMVLSIFSMIYNDSVVKTPMNDPISQSLSIIPPNLISIINSILIVYAVLMQNIERSWPYLAIYIIPWMLFTSVGTGDFTRVFYTQYLILPILEIIWPADKTNPTKDQTEELSQRKSFKMILYGWLPVQILMLYIFLYWVRVNQLSLDKIILLGASLGTSIGGNSFVIAHELIHGDRFQKFIGDILLMFVSYGHWSIEHLEGHHRRVATDEDPATSKKDEILYAFVVRTIPKQFYSAVMIEYNKYKHLPLLLALANSSIVKLWMGTLSIAGVCYYLAGASGIILFMVQSAFAIYQLERINYIEHYGLARKKLPNGNYESVAIRHSWNSDASYTNLFGFKLQRHSDHHAYPGRSYPIRRSHQEAPQLLFGYSFNTLLASTIWPWFWIMNPRLEQYQSLQKSLHSEEVEFPNASVKD